MNIQSDFKRLFDNLSTAVMIVDEDLCLVYLNSACEHLLEISFEHVYGNSITAFCFESEDAGHTARQTLTNESLYTKRRARWHLHNDKRITLDYTVTPVAETRQIIFEIQPLDRLLRISREEAAMAAQSTTRNLVRGLAHEVKNPLGGIRGAAQLLSQELEQVTTQSDLSEYTRIIIAEADRLRNLVDRMLGPRQSANFRTMNIHAALERVITLIKAETRGEIRLTRDYDPSIPDIQGDLDLLIQAILNIVHNAVQALQADKNIARPGIEIATRIQRKFTIGRNRYPLVCSIGITDNGPGIPEGLIDDIFYPMISGRANGMGLGLSISQQLINQHKGLIECTSEPGETRFSLFIPLEPRL